MAVNVRTPDILPVMVGTAGHVDHGKTRLVRCLTGCDTDRLREEKERGLSIDLGFAACMLPDNRLVGIVDVPGHEDFIRNMAAGAAVIDILMLVIAADDGVMPQTTEHMRIVHLLRKPRVMVVVTKTDLVDAETVEVACSEARDFLDRFGFADAPVVAASSETFAGLDDVREALLRLVDETVVDRDSRAFRMNVERVFSIHGRGTVVTGVPVSGATRIGDELDLPPDRTRCAVRALQRYKHDAEEVGAGACAAINLRDLDADDVERGDVLCAADVYDAADAAVVTVRSVSASRALGRVTPMKLHAGTAAVNCSLKTIDADGLSPGAEALAHLRIEEPVVMCAGDRFLLRFLSPPETVAGGTVLSVRPYRVRRSAPGLVERLGEARAAALDGDGFAAELLAGPAVVMDRAAALRLTRRSGDAAETELRHALERGLLVDAGSGCVVSAAHLDDLRRRMKKALARYHEAHPATHGMEPALAMETAGAPADAWGRLSKLLCEDDALVVRHGRLALADFRPAVDDAAVKRREEVLAFLRERDLHAPTRNTVTEELGMSKADLKTAASLLVEEGLIRPVGPALMTTDAFDRCREALLACFETDTLVDVRTFRDASGLSRNLAVDVLEAFDGEGLTRRTGDGREMTRRPDASP